MGHTQMARRRALKTGYLLPKDELLRLKHMAKRLKQFRLDGLVLPFQVQHGYGHGHGLSFGGSVWRDCSVLHAGILAVAGAERSHLRNAGESGINLFDGAAG